MSVKKFLGSLLLSIVFFINSIVFLIMLMNDYDTLSLILVILTFICGIIFYTFAIINGKSENRKEYFISTNHTYYLNGKNIFENAKVIKEKKIIRYKKYIKYKLIKSTYTKYSSVEYNIYFDVYELKDDYQLLIIKNKEFKKGVYFDYGDYKENSDNLLLKTGIPDFKIDNCIEKYVSDNRKHIIAISLINNGYVSREYVCGIVYSYSIKNVFTRMIPHWYTNRDHLSWIFDSLEEAKEKAVKSLNFINKSFTHNGVKMIYFILPNERKGTAYHEFQIGDKNNVFWDQTSLLLSEDMMEETKLGEFFAKIIPNYDYYGPTIINKELWDKILQEIESESNIINEIIIEMKSWADNSINLYGCFTINGL